MCGARKEASKLGEQREQRKESAHAMERKLESPSLAWEVVCGCVEVEVPGAESINKRSQACWAARCFWSDGGIAHEAASSRQRVLHA